MVAPLIAAAARAAASQVAKQAAKKAISSRALGLAEKRYFRAAERYLAESKKVGQRTRYGQLLSKASQRLDRFAKDLQSVDLKDGANARITELVGQSEKYLVKATRSKAARGDLLGETLLNGTMQGHRLFSITRDLWSGGSEDYDRRFEEIKDAFGGKSLSEIILEIEKKTGVNIMKGDINSKERYGDLTREEMLKVSNYIRSHYE